MAKTVLPQKSSKLVREEVIEQYWYDYFLRRDLIFRRGFTGTITTAKLTGVGANGSMTFEDGILVAQTAAT